MSQTNITPTETKTVTAPLHGVAGEFASSDELMEAIGKLRQKGFRRMEAYTPFPVHGIDDALGNKRSILGYLVFCGGSCGFLFGFLLQWFTTGIDYPLIVAGKPYFALESSIPVMFECTILFSAFTAIFGMLALNGLPRFYHPIFNYSNQRITDDAFVLVVEKQDPKFDVDALRQEFEALGARRTEAIEA